MLLIKKVGEYIMDAKVMTEDEKFRHEGIIGLKAIALDFVFVWGLSAVIGLDLELWTMLGYAVFMWLFGGLADKAARGELSK